MISFVGELMDDATMRAGLRDNTCQGGRQIGSTNCVRYCPNTLNLEDKI